MRGFMYWTLVDNFEWNFAWELKFGIYEWNPDMGMERRLRNGAKACPSAYLNHSLPSWHADGREQRVLGLCLPA